MSLSSPLAVVDPQRQLQLLHPSGELENITSNAHLQWGDWATLSARHEVHSWPAWSPDQRRVAAFRIAQNKEGHRVVVIQGARAVEVCPIGEQLPIYLSWSPSGEHIAVLSQGIDALILQVDSSLRLSGSPLFFTWLPDNRLAVFLGETDTPVLAVVDPQTGARHHLEGVPGNFCAPVVVGQEVIYAIQGRDHLAIVASGFDAPHARELHRFSGLSAFLPSPDGTLLAAAFAPDGGSDYRDLRLIDVESGHSHRLSDASCVAFFWAPNGRSLVIAQPGPTKQTLRWVLMDLTGTHRELAVLYPSRDMRFYLRFFEQYAQSHPIIQPDGELLVLGGGLVGQPDLHGSARIWGVPLQGGPPRELAMGPFAVFASS